MLDSIKVGYKSVELDKNTYSTAKYKLIAIMLFFREVIDLGFDCAHIDGDFDTIVIDGISTSNIIEATLIYLKLLGKDVAMVKNINSETNETIEFLELGDRYIIQYPYEYSALMDIVLGISCSSDRSYDTIVKISNSAGNISNNYDNILHTVANYLNKNLNPVDAYGIKEQDIEVMVCEELTCILSFKGIYIIDFFTVCSNRRGIIDSIIRECSLNGTRGLKEINSIIMLK